MDRLQQLQTLLEEDPGDSFLVFAIAKEYEKLDNLDLALQRYLDLRAKDPDYVGAYYHLAKLYEVMADTDAALEVYQAGMEVAKKLKDMHALSELQSAKLNLELEL